MSSSSSLLAMPQPKYARPGSLVGPTLSKNTGDASKHELPNATRVSVVPVPDPPRTPSPTPSEIELLDGSSRFFSRPSRETLQRLAVLAVIIALFVVLQVKKNDIATALSPATKWLRETPAAWLIPIAILIALSFPPLFGHEVVVLVCGLTWGIGEGFGIVAAGTLLGEICTYFVFSRFCSPRAKKVEAKNLRYAVLVHTIRHGGLSVAVITRFSAIPGHVTTAIFATCGMPFWVFVVAAVVALPKQLALVAVGFLLRSGDNNNIRTVVQNVVLAVTVVVSLIALWYIRRRSNQVTPEVIYARRKARARQATTFSVIRPETSASELDVEMTGSAL
ncbi:hypothetical protein HMN09_00808100 [Mycena chlorophos]|uniref:Golgi apparatus membrane protein TVP38 n=1 Tax=Mycena chlorophos TaxID=658473 RepID=A0A8H6W5F2_MYCCL|nr:hypothetical protein HMN09_00808100 [Mycena chlorophos]